MVLPVYNGAENIEKAIKSVLNQSYRNLELIVVNDCSTDGTLDIISGWAKVDSRVKIINNEINKRLPRTLNAGFKVASGDYWTWTSDDNTFHDNALQVMADYLDQNEEVDLVYTDFSVKYMDGSLRNVEKKSGPDALRYFNTIGACFLYRRQLAERIGEYDPSMFLAEDYEFWIRAYLNGNLHHLSENLYDYGWHDKSLTATRKSEIRHQTFLAKEKHFSELYARCYTKEDQIKFLSEMLSLLDDYVETKCKRKEYYKMNKAFAIRDMKKRLYSVASNGMNFMNKD